MTPPEQAQIKALRVDVMEEIAGLRRDFAPALRFYNSLAGLGENLQRFGRGLGHVVKVGIGIGSGIAPIIVALHVLGIRFLGMQF